MEQKLLDGRLLDEKGRLAQKGYATQPLAVYNREAVSAGRLRLKEWDYYLIFAGKYRVALTLADNGYMGLASASLLDVEAPRDKTVSVMKLLTLGKTGFPTDPRQGTVAADWGRAAGRFETENGVRRLTFRLDRFRGQEALTADITLTDPPRDSMVIATPFPGKENAFYYNQKLVGMRAAGRITAGDFVLELSPETDRALLDWGRGVWTYDNTWYWGAGMGTAGGREFGFNLGYGFGDTSAASENMLFLEGRSQKFRQVDFGIPQREGKDDFMAPWHFTSPDGRFDAVFTPTLDRVSRTAVGPLLSDQHQVFGTFNGYAVADDGERLPLRDFPGFAEKVRNKW